MRGKSVQKETKIITLKGALFQGIGGLWKIGHPLLISFLSAIVNIQRLEFVSSKNTILLASKFRHYLIGPILK